VERQRSLIETILSAVRQEEGVRAAFLKGSLGSGAGDDYSDVDFYCLIDPAKLDGFLHQRREILERYRPILFWAEANFVGPQVVAVYDDGLHIDFYAVTPENLPDTGAMKVLHDPDGMLSGYQARTLSIPFAEAVRHFDSFSFVLVEIEAAVKRGNRVWANHLAGHLASEFGFVYRHLHDPDRARLSLKNIDRVADAATLARLWDAAQMPLMARVLAHIALMREAAQQYPAGQQEAFNWTFFRVHGKAHTIPQDSIMPS
jgi:hypothetical protein